MVIVREEEAGDKRLVAYLVAEGEGVVTVAGMRDWVKQRLPEYMVPSTFVVLDRMPLSANGKVDRKALPAPAPQSLQGVGEMGSPVAEIIANIWIAVLRTGEVTPSSNFFDLGGHSLLGAKVIARIRQSLQVNLPLGAIFETPTIAGLADRVQGLLREHRNGVDLPLVPLNSAEAVPLSFAQQRLWFLDQLEPNSPFYNVPMALRLTGPFDTSAMEGALREVVARHSSLRTIFQLQDGEPVQVVAPAISLPLSIVDLSSLDASAGEAEARRLASEEARRPFNLSMGPLFRSFLVKLGPEDHILMVNLHHAISDGWSLGILTNELTVLYEAFRIGASSPLPSLPLTYADYSVWQRKYLEGGALEQQLVYWKRQMAGAPLSIELPTDRVRPPVQTFNGAKRVVSFPSELLERVKGLSRAEGATLFITLLSAFNVLLSRYSGQKDLVVGTAIAGRNHPETERLIGYFANTLVLRSDLSGEPSFKELLHRVRETTLNAYANQDVPFEKLVEELNPQRDISRSPLFQVMMIQQNAFQRDGVYKDVAVRPFELSGSTARVDLLLNVSEVNGELRCAFEYNTDLYDASTIQRWLEHFHNLLAAIIADPSRRISELDFLSDSEKHTLLVEWNNTAADYPRQRSLPDLIEAQVARVPDRVAVVFEDESLTYRELNQRANQLAHHLRAIGVIQETLVGVCLERSPEMLVAILAILKAGGAYLPIDPAFPKDRQAFMLADAKAPVLLTTSTLALTMSAHEAVEVHLDTCRPAIALQSEENLAPPADPANLAYVLYTSGSTGKPKGVMISHGNLVNFLESMRHEPGLTEEDTLLAVTTLSFDIAGLELWLPLYVGARVVIASRKVSMDGQQLIALLHSSQATVMQATPATWRLLLETGWTGEPNLVVLCGGEALSASLVSAVLPRCKAMWNMYGPTETTIWSTIDKVESDDRISLGYPIANTQIVILDGNAQLAPIGINGELCIGGDGVSHGYLNQPELTAEKFILNPFSSNSGARLYRTGDLARRLPDGRLEFAGRIDHQVKIRGFRIELGEIETVLARNLDVRECVVIAREDQPGNKYIAAYIVAANTQGPLNIWELASSLKEFLPDYMVPTAWVQLEHLPLSANGKIARQNLPVPDNRGTKSNAGQEPRKLTEIRLASIWEEVLNVHSVTVDDDFFSLGGHSLLAVQMMARAQEAFGCELPLTLLFGSPRLGDLAKAIQTERGKYPFKTLIPIRTGGSKPPLFCISRPNVNALGFVFLSRHLSPDQPVIGLQSKMEKDGSTWVYDQVEYEAKAIEYISAMREVYPDGPYLLTGYCEGAHIAFEMARKLEAMNLPVAMIGILDAWPIENTVSRIKFILRGYLRELRKFRSLDMVGKVHYLTRSKFVRAARRANPTPLDPAEAVLTQQARLAVEQMEKRYWPGPGFVPTQFHGRLTLFRTKKQMNVRINDYKMGWSQRALGGVEVIPVPGNHAHLLREPHVIELAQKMQDCMDCALAAQPTILHQAKEAEATLSATINVP